MPQIPARNLTAAAVISFATAILFLSPPPAAGQPYGGWLSLNGNTAYAKSAHSTALSPTQRITVEGWSSVTSQTGCRAFIGKDFQTAWWVGHCNGVLTSYVNGSASALQGGRLPMNKWFHWAMTFDGTTRRHYVNGEETLSVVAAGPVGQNTSEVRIGNDVSSNNFTYGSFTEIRIWNVARSKADIRKMINVPITTPMQGLGAQLPFGSPPVTLAGGAMIATDPPGGWCGGPRPSVLANPTTLCLHGGRYSVSVDWETADGTRGSGKVVPGGTSDSGIFWFFTDNNWELLVKVLNACAFSDYYWAFSAATTNVHYELTVIDHVRYKTKRYFNYQGENAPALNDTSAFATCP